MKCVTLLCVAFADEDAWPSDAKAATAAMKAKVLIAVCVGLSGYLQLNVSPRNVMPGMYPVTLKSTTKMKRSDFFSLFLDEAQRSRSRSDGSILMHAVALCASLNGCDVWLRLHAADLVPRTSARVADKDDLTAFSVGPSVSTRIAGNQPSCVFVLEGERRAMPRAVEASMAGRADLGGRCVILTRRCSAARLAANE